MCIECYLHPVNCIFYIDILRYINIQGSTSAIAIVSIVTAVATQSPALLTQVTEMSPTIFTTRPVVNVYVCIYFNAKGVSTTSTMIMQMLQARLYYLCCY